MLRKFLDWQLSFFEKGSKLECLRPLVSAADTFFYEAPVVTHGAPHVRDAVDLKRWMSVVVFALIPAILMAIWNTGLHKFVYTSGDLNLMREFVASSVSFQAYCDFAMKNNRFLDILWCGLGAFLPIMIISYGVGGLCEGIVASIRGHEIAEGFLVTGMLYALILPPTIPYWMAAFGVAAGVLIGKELFGGTGMNVMNPALICRAFLFFSFPGKMTGDVWVGTNPTVTGQSILKANMTAMSAGVDGVTQATGLQLFNVDTAISRIHVDAIASNDVGMAVGTYETLVQRLAQWSASLGDSLELGRLTSDQLMQFVTGSAAKGGLGLSSELYSAAVGFAQVQYGMGAYTDANFFFGNVAGSMGETSFLACAFGALVLIGTGVGSWRTMLSVMLGAYGTAWILQYFAQTLGADAGAWNPAKYAFPAYKHMIMGGLAFGAVFMATDPVSSPAMKNAKWAYGFLIGFLVVIIRSINPAYPEGVMLAILFGNVFAPLFDYIAVRNFRRQARVAV